MGKMLTRQQTADMLGISTRTLNRNRLAWGLDIVRLSNRTIRFKQDQVEKLVAERSY